MSDWSDSDLSSWSAEISTSAASNPRTWEPLRVSAGMSSDYKEPAGIEPASFDSETNSSTPRPSIFPSGPSGPSRPSILYRSPSSNVPSSSKKHFRPQVEVNYDLHTEGLFLSKEETAERMAMWKKKSGDGKFDLDTYIVDPITHYSYLEHTEESVVTSSEYFRCRGYYQCEDNSLRGYRASNILPDLRGMESDNFSRSLRDDNQQYQHEKWILDSLWKSYLILSRTVEAFDSLISIGFCTTFYSMLVERRSTNEAELIRINSTLLYGLKTGIENAIRRIFNRDPEGTEYTLTSFVATQCDIILEHMGFVPEGNVPICAICRITVLLLDLALVSYVGSHGSHFTSYVNSSAESIEIQSTNEDVPSFKCTLRNLACLSDFLDNCKVWVFNIKDHRSTHGHEKLGGLSILTRMEEFADIWGPVWTIPVGPEQPNRVLQYKLSRGFIRPVADGAEHVVECHWYSNDDDHTTASNLSMDANDLLSIGAGLLENDRCLYTLGHYESRFGAAMGFLGTISEGWALDTRTLALGVGQYLVATASGTQKKIPAVTLKEHTWNKLKHDPQSANIQFLNNLTGIEISHCTGNARRVHLKDLFRLKRVRERLAQYYPAWEQTEWGVLFSEALENDDFEAIHTLWVHRRDLRSDLGGFIAQMLELLHVTGLKGDSIIAAYFGEHQDRNIKMNVSGNEWGRCLRDSILMASYVVIGDICLKYPKRDQITTTCSRELDETTLATRIIFNGELPSKTDCVRLEPTGSLFRVSKIRPGRITLVPSDGQLALRMLHPTTKIATEIVAKIGTWESQNEFVALVKASTKSFGGLTEMRQEIQQRIVNPALNHERRIDDLPAPRRQNVQPRVPRNDRDRARKAQKRGQKVASARPPRSSNQCCCSVQ